MSKEEPGKKITNLILMNRLGGEFLDRVSVHNHIDSLARVVIALAIDWAGFIALATFSSRNSK
jgi:hypothetical protein